MGFHQGFQKRSPDLSQTPQPISLASHRTQYRILPEPATTPTYLLFRTLHSFRRFFSTRGEVPGVVAGGPWARRDAELLSAPDESLGGEGPTAEGVATRRPTRRPGSARFRFRRW